MCVWERERGGGRGKEREKLNQDQTMGRVEKKYGEIKEKAVDDNPNETKKEKIPIEQNKFCE